MTLVVIYKIEGEEEICALADTRSTDINGFTTSNFAPKLFSLPIKETCGDPKANKINRWECGFAFAGYVVAANYVFATTAAVMSNINVKSGQPGLSLREIADITKKIYQDIFFDICFRQSRLKGYIIDSAVALFGYCPVEGTQKCFVIRSGFVAGPHPVVVMSEHSNRPIAAVLGSGKEAFKERGDISVKNRGFLNVMEVFEGVVLDSSISHVGGGVQMLRARRGSVTIPPILNPTDDPDAPDFMIYGVRTDSLIDKSRCTIGYQEDGSIHYGFGIRNSLNRRLLSDLGFDPDSTQISQRERNTAAMFGAVASVWGDRGTKVRLDEKIYRLSCLSPMIGNPYIGGYCPTCGYFCPIVPDSDRKGVVGVFEGDSQFDILCSSCFGTFRLPPSVLVVKNSIAKPSPVRRLWNSTSLRFIQGATIRR